MAVQSEHHPTLDLDSGEREAERRRQKLIAGAAEDDDLIWLLSGRKGRRVVRRQLIDAQAWPMDEAIATSFIANYGAMSFHEGQRSRAFPLLGRIVRLTASGGLPFDSFQKLFMETD